MKARKEKGLNQGHVKSLSSKTFYEKLTDHSFKKAHGIKVESDNLKKNNSGHSSVFNCLQLILSKLVNT